MGRVAGGLDLENCVLHGEYERSKFVEIAKRIDADIGCIFSIWPETYCHTLTELWAAGLPVIAFDIGAVGDRLRENEAGWLLEKFSSKAVLDLLGEILANPDYYRDKGEKGCKWQRVASFRETCNIMAAQYRDLYRIFLQ